MKKCDSENVKIYRRLGQQGLERLAEDSVEDTNSSLKVKADTQNLCSTPERCEPEVLFRPAKLIHPALDFKPQGVLLGFTLPMEGPQGVCELPYLIYGTGEGSFVVQVGDSPITLGETRYVIHGPNSLPPLESHWSLQEVEAFARHPASPLDLYGSLKATFQRYLDLTLEGHFGLLAAWTVATYFAPLFPAFPFLLFLGPKESAKSKALEILTCSSFNGIKVKSISEPAIGDTADGLRATILFDQAEALPVKMTGLLADSYKKAGGQRWIVSRRGGNRQALGYSCYGPKAFAAQKPLDPDLRDRCIQIPMRRSLRELPDLMGNEPEWRELRDMCYRFLLTYWREVRSVFEAIPPTGTRRGELWRPLEAVLRVLRVPDEETQLIKQVVDLGTELTRDRLEPAVETLFLVLGQHARQQAEFELTPTTILQQIGLVRVLGKGENESWLGKQIALYQLAKFAKKKTRRKEVHYLFESAQVLDITSRYLDADVLAEEESDSEV